MFFYEVRMVTYFGLVFVLWWGYGLSQRDGYRRWLSHGSIPWKGPPRYMGLMLAVGLAAFLITLPYARRQLRLQAVPTAVVAWVNGHPHQVIFNPDGDGGYLLAHNVRGVYIDGRADFYLFNGHRFQWYAKIVSGTARPRGIAEAFQRSHVTWILWPEKIFNGDLGWFIQSDHWHLIYRRQGWLIFAKPGP